MKSVKKINMLKRKYDLKRNINVKCERSTDKLYNRYTLKKIILSEELEKVERDEYFNDASITLVTSLMDRKEPFIYSIKNNLNQEEFQVDLITYDEQEDMECKLRGVLTGIELDKGCLTHDEEFKYHGMITGIPNIELGNSIDKFINAFVQKDFILSVQVLPLKNKSEGFKGKLIKEINDNYPNMKEIRTLNKIEQSSESKRSGESSNKNGGIGMVLNFGETSGKTSDETNSNSYSCSEGINSESIERSIQEYVELLENHLKRLDFAESSGLWEVNIIISMKEERDLNTALEIYKALYNNEPIETFESFIINNNFKTYSLVNNFNEEYTDDKYLIYTKKSRYSSIVTGEELSKFIQFPLEEYRGYEIVREPRFSQQCIKENQGSIMGNIKKNGMSTDVKFKLNEDDLNKHILVAGITGSGKTNTIFSIISEMNKPFLAIEPAKTEYRALKKLIPELRIYTLGKEEVSPFRLNPFKFHKGVNVQQHIDNLKVIFTAAFTMYASMPNILEQCITNVYLKKGWSLVTSKNIYFECDEVPDEFYPSLEDLYIEIDIYTKKLGYAQEQTQNIRAALLTRIKSLISGGKGYMLNTSKSIDIWELLRYPTVLELEGVADDEEKALIIGFLMMNIYEYIKVENSSFSNKLKGSIIIEEAHRLFSNIQTSGSAEGINTKGKAVETLSNIICEIRAYGYGMIVADQVPIKLAPDVMKNTNTKIIHRLVSKDDCEYVSNSIGVDDEESKYLSKLKTGNALILTEGMNYPAHVHVKEFKDSLDYLNDSEIEKYSLSYNYFKDNSEKVHPSFELIMNNSSLMKEVGQVIDLLYKEMNSEDITKFRDTYVKEFKKIKGILVDYGYEYGLEDRNVNYFIMKAIEKYLCANEKLANNIKKKIYTSEYIKKMIYFVNKKKGSSEKLNKLMELSRDKL